MLSSELEFCLNEAFQNARDHRHEFMTVEHLLLALLDIPKVHEILKACDSNIPELRRQLTECAASARLSARITARRLSCAVQRQEGGDQHKRTGSHF